MDQSAVAGKEDLAGTAADKVAALRRILAAQAPKISKGKDPIATGIELVDTALQGGLQRGKVVEVSGSSGRMTLSLCALAGATRQGLAAFIDATDGLDAAEAQRMEVDLERLLWVRLRDPKDALRAADLLLVSGGFCLIVVYLCGAAAGALRWGDRVWPRLVQRCEQAGTALLVVGDKQMAGSSAAASLLLQRERVLWDRVPGDRSVLAGQVTRIEIVRNRLGPPGGAQRLVMRK